MSLAAQFAQPRLHDHTSVRPPAHQASYRTHLHHPFAAICTRKTRRIFAHAKVIKKQWMNERRNGKVPGGGCLCGCVCVCVKGYRWCLKRNGPGDVCLQLWIRLSCIHKWPAIVNQLIPWAILSWESLIKLLMWCSFKWNVLYSI